MLLFITKVQGNNETMIETNFVYVCMWILQMKNTINLISNNFLHPVKSIVTTNLSSEELFKNP